ncbi:MAG: DUF5693 family protein [Trueperaceae bacterium]|nr:DUF5693 family protein [Trueperaceae bacterium]
MADARRRIRVAAALLLAAALLPAGLLLTARLEAEGAARPVALVMDGDALEEQARLLGRDPVALAAHYRTLGLSAVAVYEDTPETLAAKGRIALLRGADAVAAAVAAGAPPPDVPAHATLVRDLVPGASDALRAKAPTPPAAVTIRGVDWWAFPGDVADRLPAGPDEATIAAYAEAGLDVVYRPRSVPGVRNVGAYLPDAASVLVHEGQTVAGYPHAMDATLAAAQGRWTAYVENNPQAGIGALRGRAPILRLLSFEQAYLDLRLPPHEVIDKFVLAATERNVSLLYLRPYLQNVQGDALANTEALVAGLAREVRAEGFAIGTPPLGRQALDAYAPPAALRVLASLGVAAGVTLLATAFPGLWGVAVAAALAALGLAAAGLDFGAVALVAALTFPVLGYVLPGPRRGAFWRAAAWSLVGAAFLAAVGSDRDAVLGVAPFRGVAATLVVPPALYVAWALLRTQGAFAWLRDGWRLPVRLGPVVLAGVALAGFALVVLRRGNTPLIGASELELQVRALLSEAFARPRFKELLGHPLAVVGLSEAGGPAWLRAGLMAGGVVAQASILNSFAHYHTPLLVSLERTGVALALGFGLGTLAVAALRPTVAWVRRRLAAA